MIVKLDPGLWAGVFLFSGYLDNVQREGDYLILIHCPEMYDLTMASK